MTFCCYFQYFEKKIAIFHIMLAHLSHRYSNQNLSIVVSVNLFLQFHQLGKADYDRMVLRFRTAQMITNYYHYYIIISYEFNIKREHVSFNIIQLQSIVTSFVSFLQNHWANISTYLGTQYL